MSFQWTMFRKFYARKFGISEKMVDLIASYEILKLSVSGYSNKRISNRLLVSATDVQDSLLEFLDFFGWDFDLDFSPISLYNKSKGVFMAYDQEISMLTGRLSDYEAVRKSFEICEKFSKLKEKVDMFYGTKN